MNKFFKSVANSVRSFAKDEDGAQVIEYALIVAVVSIALVIALKTAFGTDTFAGFVTRVTACLTTGTCASPAPAA